MITQAEDKVAEIQLQLERIALDRGDCQQRWNEALGNTPRPE